MNEKHHAFLILCFYKVLDRQFREDGKDIFRNAAKKYAEERGRRMALRAERHGLKKDYTAYLSHAEWTASDPGFFNTQQELQEPGCIVTRVYRCPWNTVFMEHGGIACGQVYCRIIDTHIVKGFNPDLRLDVGSLLYSSDCCTFYWRDGEADEQSLQRIAEITEQYKNENIMPFDYHVGHLFTSFQTEIVKRYGTQGEALIADVIKAIRDEFGDRDVETVLKYQRKMQKSSLRFLDGD